MKRSFVYVVCGEEEHINTLNYSIKALRSRSQADIFVVTDQRRNPVAIDHNNVVSITTPEDLDNHQASIWLKTSLLRHLPKGRLYAYLDTDVIAVGQNVDRIFDEYISPIRFANDHCKMPAFSPYALNCGCKNSYDEFIKRLHMFLDREDPLRLVSDPILKAKQDKLSRLLSVTAQNRFVLIKKGLKYLVSWPIFKFDDDFYFDRSTRMWKDGSGNEIMKMIYRGKIAKEMDLDFNLLSYSLRFKNGKPIWSNECDHLMDGIKDKFTIEINDANWQHRNGGVFIFCDSSAEFMNAWHEMTMRIFRDPAWKTRDQGTLIATYWKFGIQNQLPLHRKWNFICDYHNPLLKFDAKNNLISDDGKNFINPEFLHIYHHFGDENWDLWHWADRLANQSYIPMVSED